MSESVFNILADAINPNPIPIEKKHSPKTTIYITTIKPESKISEIDAETMLAALRFYILIGKNIKVVGLVKKLEEDDAVFVITPDKYYYGVKAD